MDKLDLPQTLNKIWTLVDAFKSRVADAGDDEIATLVAVLDDGDKLALSLRRLPYIASCVAEGKGEHLLRLLRSYDSSWPQTRVESFWKKFQRELEEIEKGGTLCVQECLSRCMNGMKLEISKLNPPVDIFEKLISIPGFGRNDFDTYLSIVLNYGGSIDLVKLLVRSIRNDDSAHNICYYTKFSDLIQYRQQHDPNSFSEILRYMVHQRLKKGKMVRSLLPNLTRFPFRCLPLELIWHTLKRKKKSVTLGEKNGTSYSDVVEDEDLVFLMKATSYAHYMRSEKFIPTAIEDIDKIPLLHAFLKCHRCFTFEAYDDLGFAKQMIKYLIVSADEKKNVLVKDLEGEYPLFQLLAKKDYFIRPGGTMNLRLRIPLAKILLKLVPDAARLTNSNGIHPLHVVAHPDRFNGVDDRGRLAMVDSVLKAYPEAIDIVDKETLLPPFLLPALFNRERKQKYDISSSFLLLRERPGLLCGIKNEVGTDGAGKPQASSSKLKLQRKLKRMIFESKTPPKKKSQAMKKPQSIRRVMVCAGPADDKLLAGKEGWSKYKFRRESGATAGRIDNYWYSPGGYKFASMAEIKRFLQALNGNDEAAAYKIAKPKSKSTSKRPKSNVEDKLAGEKKRAKVSK